MSQATFATHEVFNQSPPFEDIDLYAVDRPLVEAVAANGGASAQSELSEFGKHWGSAAMAERGRVANENTPKLRTFDSTRQPPRRGRVSSGLSRADGAQCACRRAQFDLERGRQAGRRRVRGDTRGEILHGRAGRDRASLPDHHDAGLGRRAGGAAGSAGQGDAGARHAHPTIRRLRRGGPSAA